MKKKKEKGKGRKRENNMIDIGLQGKRESGKRQQSRATSARRAATSRSCDGTRSRTVSLYK